MPVSLSISEKKYSTRKFFVHANKEFLFQSLIFYPVSNDRKRICSYNPFNI